MTRRAVILAAGRGSRLDPAHTETFSGDAAADTAGAYSKPLLRLGGQTLLERTIRSCWAAGARRILVVTGFHAERIERDLGRYNDGSIETVFNAGWRKANGLSLYVCRQRLERTDGFCADDGRPHLRSDDPRRPARPSSAGGLRHAGGRSQGGRNLRPGRRDEVRVDNARRITAIGKTISPFNAIDCGLFCCSTGVFSALAEAMDDDGDCALSQGMSLLAARQQLLALDIGDRWWQDVDTPQMLAEAQRQLASRGEQC